eukprot:CAMPEP_0201593988 /NCGR_PEP_ID=MMETSP0190_2-20130828/191443_1 /ASSEMBLY_ACC=CAM_ASM_000263 /TAXON_ID=37353 /ORGANISM="Rosalina sp." /LENGTH=225 /DNA_ID=CAMNT_0048053427 /DNA_START=33 /DNA_END=710 /DNA_ORIENTATION=+
MKSCLSLCNHVSKSKSLLYLHQKALFASNLPTPALPASAVDAREIPTFDREQAMREGSKLYVPGPPFQFAVRTDKSIRKQDWAKMFPHYECVKDRVVLVPSYTTTSLSQSRIEVTRLYRKMLRMLPQTLTDYNAWHVSVPAGRKRIKEEFMKNAHVRDTRVIDKLRIKAEMDYQSYLIGRYHENIFYRFFTPDENRNPVPDVVRKKQPHGKSPFLSNFYAGDKQE